MSDLMDVQYFIASLVRDWHGEPGHNWYEGRPIGLWWVARETGVQEREAVAALELLAADGHVEIRRWNGRGYLLYVPGRHRVDDFVCPDFKLLLTPEGMRWFDTERRTRTESKRLRIGDAAGDETLARAVADALRGKDLSKELREAFERALKKLIWIAVHGYSDAEFLQKRAVEFLERSAERGGRRDLENAFYLPFIHAEAPALLTKATRGDETCDGTPEVHVEGPADPVGPHPALRLGYPPEDLPHRSAGLPHLREDQFLQSPRPTRHKC